MGIPTLINHHMRRHNEQTYSILFTIDSFSDNHDSKTPDNKSIDSIGQGLLFTPYMKHCQQSSSCCTIYLFCGIHLLNTNKYCMVLQDHRLFTET